MNSEQKRALWTKIKTALLALLITFLLVALVGGKNNGKGKQDLPKLRKLEQRVTKLETSLRDNREMFDEAREANRTLREVLLELRGIHNDCQRNATENFLHPPRQR